MTTIISDGLAIAADSLTVSRFKFQGPNKKIFRLKDGSLIGMAGHSICWQPVMDWLNGGERPTFKKAEFAALILKKNGDLLYVDDELHTDKLIGPYAIGSGAPFAMGALLAGADLRKAVNVAIKLDENSGGPVYVVKL
jgi:hypothetical protein